MSVDLVMSKQIMSNDTGALRQKIKKIRIGIGHMVLSFVFIYRLQDERTS